jgi:hypothetical protein
VAKRSFANQAGWLATAIAIAAAVGAATTAAIGVAPPADLRAAPAMKQLAVGHDSFDDSRTVQVAITSSTPVPLSAPAAGRLTAFSCAPGSGVSSGSSPLSLDGSPKLALATRIPLWRDLTPDLRGDDVRAFQEELNRLGFPVTSDGVMGRNTMKAAKAAFERIGVTMTSDLVPLASIVWIPAATATVSKCDAALGADVQQGAALATFTSLSPVVTITNLPTDLLPGDRLVELGPSTFPADANGVVRVPDLAALGAIPSSDGTDATTKPIEAQLVLAEPVPVSVVPPSAVYAVHGTDGCVASRGEPRPVRILGSQLGETLVTFAEGEAPARVDTSPAKRPPCT